MADLHVASEGETIVVTIGDARAVLTLSEADGLRGRISAANAEASRALYHRMQDERIAASLATLKSAHPDGWRADNAWCWVVRDDGRLMSSRIDSYHHAEGYALMLAAGPKDVRWRFYNGRLAHIPGGGGVLCGEYPGWQAPSIAGPEIRVCPRCAAKETK